MKDDRRPDFRPESGADRRKRFVCQGAGSGFAKRDGSICLCTA